MRALHTCWCTISGVRSHRLIWPTASWTTCGAATNSCIPALPMVDSVKTVNLAARMPPRPSTAPCHGRSSFRAASNGNFSPRVLQEYQLDDTDELIVAQRKGLHAKLVEGDPDAFALEIPRDVGLS